MKKFLILVILFLIGETMAVENIFNLKSTTLKNNQELPKAQVYKGFGCDGGNSSPDLSWDGAPLNTKSFALICHDPDAPHEFGWYHWLVININKNITSIKPNQKIKGSTETITDFKTTGFGGACPPKGHGPHRYIFTVYALDVEKLDVKQDTKPKEVEDLVKSHTIAKSSNTAIFERK